MRSYSSLTPREQRATARRLRLEWASSGDVEHAAGVGRLIDDAARVARRRYGRPSSGRVVDDELKAAYEGAA